MIMSYFRCASGGGEMTAIYNALVAKGVYPASKSVNDIVNAINSAAVNPTISVGISTRLSYNNSPRTPVTGWYTFKITSSGTTITPNTGIHTGAESGYNASAWFEGASGPQ
jgi:hypothetical protein